MFPRYPRYLWRNTQPKINVIQTPPLRVLSDYQIKIIKDSWEILNKHPVESGQAIFYTFLKRYPEHKKRYPAFRNMTLEELKDTPQIRHHCSRIMEFFGAAIDSLGTEQQRDILVTALSDNADYHGKKGITKEHFIQMRDVMLEVISGACKLDDEEKKAWSDLMDIMYHITFNVLDALNK
ncbi:unnamed protein product [Chironomus riparius]|uniref:Globin domain-containing protein n=1 Tax=Chironomus riparius TaxID=315576 RepID=A0A9N9S6B2_9DIPT|nr:unnamed protein product [Chironomus riparius]